MTATVTSWISIWSWSWSCSSPLGIFEVGMNQVIRCDLRWGAPVIFIGARAEPRMLLLLLPSEWGITNGLLMLSRLAAGTVAVSYTRIAIIVQTSGPSCGVQWSMSRGVLRC